MAQINSATLSYSQQGSNVIFSIDMDIRFETRELNKEWFIKGHLSESDILSRDDLILSIGDSSDDHFNPDTSNFSLSFTKVVNESTVDTEWGKETVYAFLEVLPLESPEPFHSDWITTNQVKVPV